MKRKKKAARRGSTTVPQVVVIKGAEVLTLDAQERRGRLDLRIEEGRIAAMGEKVPTRGVTRVIDAKGLVALPGFVQIHVHLCQTLFRAQAEEMELLDWLRERIWPMEGALEVPEMRASARLGIAELLLSGTTTILDMGSVRHTDALFAQAEALGIRYVGGKTIMDRGQGYPAGLRETTEEAIHESTRLCARWHGQAGGRLRYAFSPRFVLSASEEAVRACVHEARRTGALLHTHSSENAEEVALVRERTGMGNVEYLHSLGFSGPDVVLAHGVWLSPQERALLRETRTRIAHCPTANLKLASGIARVDELLAEGVHVGLGADGAPCSNGLDAFAPMRLAALLHKVRGGPKAIPATQALRLATVAGAQALGLDDVGTLEVGKRADIQLLDLRRPHVWPPQGDLAARIVHSGRPSDVHTVLVDGRVLVDAGKLVVADVAKILREAERATTTLRRRALIDA
ncbi:MAG: 5'-deoxyadenosine deaminase [Myxococcota bacterium]